MISVNRLGEEAAVEFDGSIDEISVEVFMVINTFKKFLFENSISTIPEINELILDLVKQTLEDERLSNETYTI